MAAFLVGDKGIYQGIYQHLVFLTIFVFICTGVYLFLPRNCLPRHVVEACRLGLSCKDMTLAEEERDRAQKSKLVQFFFLVPTYVPT